ncbi:ATPase, T2SS/T4P/T4SS family [Mariniluteicoccus endophyticus]
MKDKTALRSVALFQTPSAPPDLSGVATVFSRDEMRRLDTRTPSARDHEVVWETVALLRRDASQRIADRTPTGMQVEDRRMLAGAVIREVVRVHAERLSDEGRELWSIDLEEAYARSVESAIFGYGRLQPLFELPDAENIEIHGHDSVVVQRSDGTRYEHPPVADSDDELVEAVRFLGEGASPPRPFDDAHPSVTIALGDRFRLHAIGFGLSFRPSVTIRQHTWVNVTLPDLVADGMLPESLAKFLHAAVQARRSIVISGDQGAGKTTLLRALIAAIPPTERFGTVETDYELLTHLQPHRRNILALQARSGLGERQYGRALGEYTVADLIPEALRQNLARIVVGEVRGNEAAAMFEAMAAGAGTLSTTHSHSAAATMDRLAGRVARGGEMTIDEAYRQIAHNVSLLVHCQLVDDTWRGGTRRRFVSEVRELTGAMEGDRPVTHLTYRAEPSATEPAGFFPSPRSVDELARYAEAWS